MGWVHDSDDGCHEAFLAPVFADGTRGNGISTKATDDAHLVIVDAIYSAPGPGEVPGDVFVTRAAGEVVGWSVVCDCRTASSASPQAWVSDLLARVESPTDEDLHAGRFYSVDADVVDLGAVERYEVAARLVWHRDHLAPGAALAGLAAARRGVEDAEAALDAAVAGAREAGHSWEQIARELGLSLRSVQGRWS